MDKDPKIMFGGKWISASDALHKMESASVATDVIERFNNNFPHLASEITKDVVPLARKRLKNIKLMMPEEPNKADFDALVKEILENSSPEEALDILEQEHGQKMDMQGLISLAGAEAYVESLRRDAVELEINMISADQTAELWNEIGRPAPGGGLWNEQKVEKVLSKSLL